jgi:hypothetical protein
MRLRELQQSFQNRVLRHRRGIESQLNDAQGEDFEPRLNAYVGGYRTRLIEALAATYPALKFTLGADEFEQEMRLYIDSSHSRRFSIRYYGADVAQWISSSVTLGWEGTALAELARWEWTLADVFDAPDDDPLTVEDLSKVVPERWPTLSFSLRACVHRFDSRTNAVEWWRAANRLCEKPTALSKTSPSRWLIWRRGVTTLFRSLDSIEAELLAEVRRGATFGAICERVARSVGEDQSALRAASMLRGWLAEEIIREFSLPSANE